MPGQEVRKISKLIHERVTKEYSIYDDFNKYLETISNREHYSFLFEDVRQFCSVIIDDVKYYSLYDYDMGMLLTESAFEEFKKTATRIYTLHESNLIRTQRNSNTRFTGHLQDKKSVIEYMRDDRRSWLPQIYKEIDEEVSKLQKQIDTLKQQKELLLDDEYLNKNIEEGFIITKE